MPGPDAEDSRSKIRNAIERFPRPVTPQEIAEDTGLSEPTVYRRLNDLEDEGEVKKERGFTKGRGRHPSYYQMSE